MYVSNVDIYGFQFTATGVTLTGASSGLGETSFSASTGNVLGFDFSGASLPAGAGLLAHIDFEESSTGSLLSLQILFYLVLWVADISINWSSRC